MIISENKKVLILIVIAFLFSFILRLIWVYQFQDVESFKFNNQFMLNTNDGYFWAEGAKDFLLGKSENGTSPIYSLPSLLAAIVSKVLGVSLESVLFYLPAMVSSLIVIPLILISKLFNELETGFFAALIASIAWSYYNRTMVGYYDTDFLNILLPVVLLWSLIWALKTLDNKYFLIAAIDTIIYRQWYPSSYSLELAFIGLILLFSIYLKLKKQDIKPSITLITFMLFAMINLDSWLKIIIVVILFLFLKYKKEIFSKYIYYIFSLAGLFFLLTGGFDPVISQLKGYVFREAVQSGNSALNLQFYSVMQTVREANSISFETFSNRISGSIWLLIVSIIGYVFFVYRYPLFLLSLPMLALGFLALNNGLRFTIYAVPIMAIGTGYFIVVVSKLLNELLNKNNIIIKYLIMSMLLILALYPHVKHIVEYKIPTVFVNEEVAVLDKLNNITTKEDYMIAWWDYGYPIRYYTNMKTLIDGANHGGRENFLVSFALMNSQNLAAKITRLYIEEIEKRNDLQNKDKRFENGLLEQLILDSGYKTGDDFFLSLDNEENIPNKTKDIYFYLPNRMLNILPTVLLFSNINLMTGEQKQKPFFFQSSRFKFENGVIDLGSGVKIKQKNGLLQLGNKHMKINRFITTVYDNKNKLFKNIQTLDRSSNINVIYMKNYNKFLVLDNKMLDSLYIQLYILENFNNKYFEPVILNPYVKIYKLKI